MKICVLVLIQKIFVCVDESRLLRDRFYEIALGVCISVAVEFKFLPEIKFQLFIVFSFKRMINQIITEIKFVRVPRVPHVQMNYFGREAFACIAFVEGTTVLAAVHQEVSV